MATDPEGSLPCNLRCLSEERDGVTVTLFSEGSERTSSLQTSRPSLSSPYTTNTTGQRRQAGWRPGQKAAGAGGFPG